MRITRRQDRKRPHEPATCRCEAGGDGVPAEHRKPGKKAADHGNPFLGTGCIHSELALSTRPRARAKAVRRLDGFAFSPDSA